MPFNLPLPDELRNEGWKVKIRDKERAEPPHVSIIKRLKTWRWGLREQKFLDRKSPHRDVPRELLKCIKANLHALAEEWNRMYPHNSVGPEES